MRQTIDDPHEAAPVDDTYERLFLVGVFAFMAVALFVYVWKFGRNVPFWDDWELVPVLSGHSPFSLEWLWKAHNEHVIPIVRLVVYVVWRITGDLRAIMLLTSALLCAGVWALVETARRMRGHSTFTDAIFPLALLSWGLFENHIFAMQFFFVGAALLAIAIVLLGVGDWQGRPARVAGIAVCLVLLPMFGAIGLAMLPCLLGWVVIAGIQSLRSGTSCARREGLTLLAACAVATAIAAAYVIGFPAGSTGAPRASIVEMARAASEILSTSIGQAGEKLWPWSTIGTVAVVVAAIVVTVRSAARRADERNRAILLLAGIGALLSLVAAISFGRGAFGHGQGFSNRYALFSAALLCISTLSVSIHATGGFGRFVRTGVLLALTAAFVTNTWAGLVYGIDRADRADALTEAIDAGAPPDVAAARHADRLYPIPALFAERLEMLRVARAGPYSRPQAFPGELPCREVTLPVTRLGEHQIYVDGSTYRAVGNDPFVVFALPASEYVCGVRLRYTLTNASPEAPAMQLFWANPSDEEFREGRRSTSVSVARTTEVQESTVWIYSSVDRLRIDPDHQPCTFELHEITFLVRDRPR
jgi:hypothetical protein